MKIRFLAFFLLLSIGTFAQNIGGPILSNFEEEFYSATDGVLLEFTYVGHHVSTLQADFIQVFVAETKPLNTGLESKKALVIGHSQRRKILGRHDFIDADEVPALIAALEHFVNKLSNTKPDKHQSFIWTSRGGYQINATFSLDVPRRFILSSKMDALSSISNTKVLFNKQVRELLESLKNAQALIRI